MQLQDIRELYYGQEIEDAKIALGQYLTNNPEDTEGLFLRAEMLIDEVPQPQHPHEYSLPEDYEEATKLLKYILHLDPDAAHVIHKILAIAAINFEDGNAAEHQELIDRLIQNPDYIEDAARYGLMLNTIYDQHELPLSYLDILIEQIQISYAHDRQIRDIILTGYYDSKAKILYDIFHKTEEALDIYRTHIRILVFETVAEFIEIAQFAIDAQDASLLNRIIQKTFHYFDEDEDADSLIQFYKDLKKLPAEFLSQLNHYEEFQMIMERVFTAALELTTADIRSHAQAFIQQYPERALGYHFLGTSYYTEGQFEEALPYLEKATTYTDASAATLFRYCQSHYAVHQRLPQINYWPDSPAIDYYNMGVYFGNWEDEISTAHNSLEFLAIRKGFYAKAFEGYRAYFEADTQDSVRLYSDHFYATCCNNYAISLYQDLHYTEAIEVALIGISKSPFIELYQSLMNAYFFSEQYQLVIDTYEELDTADIEEHYYLKYVTLTTQYITAKIRLGQVQEARQLFAEQDYKFSEFKDEIDYSEITEEDEAHIRMVEKEIQNTRFNLVEADEELDMLTVWEDQLQRNPQDPSTWFMLFQEYYAQKRYADCIHAATEYKRLKPIQEQRGKSYLYLEMFQEAKEDFEACLQIFSNVSDEGFLSSRMDVVFYYAQSAYQLQDYAELLPAIEEFIADYVLNNYTRDEQWKEAILIKAKSLKALGKDKMALQTVKDAVAYDPEFQEAKQLAKEWKGGFFSFFK